jgi:hypothetical protein
LIEVHDFVNNTFSDNWCGHIGPITWPPNSLDLTPAEFFVWEFVKNIVYAHWPQDMDDLKM